MFKMFKYARGLLVSGLLAFSLAACGGGNAGSPGATLSGTAATGKAIANGSVLLKDSSGDNKSTTTDSNGKFSFDVTGLKPPFLLKISTGGTDLYSIATQAGTVNIHQLSDLIVRNYFAAKGLQPDYQILAGLVLSDIANIELTIRNTITMQLRDQNVDDKSFNLLNTPFDANNTKFDAVLDILKVVLDDVRGEMRIVLIDPNNSGAEGPSIGVFSNSVSLASSPLNASKDGINQTLTSWKDTVNKVNFANYTTAGGKQAGFQAGLLPLYRNDYLNRGMTATDDIGATLATDPGNITVLEVKDIITVDSFKKIVTATMNVATVGWGSKTLLPMSFIYDDSKKQWLYYGDQRIAGITLSLSSSVLNLSVYDSKDQIDSVTVAGPGISGTKLLARDAVDPKKLLLSVTTISTSSGFPANLLALEGSNSISPDASVYTFTLTLKTGGSVTYKITPLSGVGLLDPHGH